MGADRLVEAFETHNMRIYHYCLTRTGNRADAEDLTSETFARFARYEARVAPKATYAWLTRVAANLCIDHSRRMSRRELALAHEDGLVVGAGRTVDGTASSIDGADMRLALSRLRPAQQRVLYLRVVEDLPFSEVARLLRKREGAAKMQYRRALEALDRSYREVQQNDR